MIKKELAVFLIVGGLTVVLDYLTYRSIVWLDLFESDLAKGVGFLTGTIFSYFANRFCTFSIQNYIAGSVWRFSALYVLTLFINVYVNSLLLSAMKESSYSVQAAFLVATGLSAALNFMGMKYFVFVDNKISETI